MHFYQNPLLAALTCAALFFSCQSENSKVATAEAGATQPKVIEISQPDIPQTGAAAFAVSEGTVFWQATKALGGPTNGSFNVKSGELLVNGGQVVGGQVEIDLASVAVSSQKDPQERSSLENHLRESDFFDVKKYPVGTFKIEELLPSQLPDFNFVVAGALTLKGQTRSVNVPVKISLEKNVLTARSAAFVINRTHWGINYKSTVVGTAKDKLIDDNVLISLELKARGE